MARASGGSAASRTVASSTRQSTRGGDSQSRFDSQFTTGSRGLTNARTKIVGDRTGFLADLIIALVRMGGAIRTVSSRVFGRIASVITPLGWVLLVLTPVALATGYAFGIIEVVVLGWALLVLLIVAVIYLIGRSPMTLALGVPRSRVVVGDRAVGQISIANPSRRRAFGTTVEVPVGPGLVELAIPGLAAGGEDVREFVVPSARRGVIPVGPVRTVRADPIGIVRRDVVWADVAELFVHPRTISIPRMSTGLIRDLEGNPTRDLATNDISFHAIREYVPGDERRNIHWKSSAKTGTYMVRQFEETRRSHLVIALSLASSDFGSEDEFELAVSVAGSLGARAIRDARTLTAVTSVETPQFAKRKLYAVRELSTLSRSRLLDDLSGVAMSEAALSMIDVARVTGDQSAGVSVAFLVCGSGVSPQELRIASTLFPVGVEVVAVVCDPNTQPGLRRVAGLSVLTIGYLDDLQKALSRSVTV